MKRLHTCLWLFVCCLTPAICAEPTKPNVVFILTDDLGYGDLTCYHPGSDIATPHIDELANEGVRFTQFYAASNVCAPSRRAILTGRYPSRLGEWAEAYQTTPEDTVINARDEPCFPLFLKRAGYVNGMFGKWNIGSVNGVSTPEAQGFDYWIGSHHNTSYFGHRNGGKPDFWKNGQPAPQFAGQFADDVFVDKAIGFIKENRSKPFFVYLALFTPHAPFQDPADPNEHGRPDLAVYNEMGVKPIRPPNPTDRPVVKKMIQHVDRRIGDLMKTLADLGLEENTLVIFTSDNGGTGAAINQPLSGFKQQMLEGGIRVPSMIKWPAKVPAGKISAQAGISMDFTRTILAAAGAESHIPEGRELDGVDLMPMLTGEAEEMERSLFWRRREWKPGASGHNTVWTESLLKGDWKYIKEFRQAPGFGRAQIGAYNKQGYVELLFNLKQDISEKKNLALEEPGMLAAMRAEFEQWRAKTVDRHRHYRIPVVDQYGTEPFGGAQSKQTTEKEAPLTEKAFQIAEIFSSDMILQREVMVPVWGRAPDGTVVTISFHDKEFATTSEKGQWRVNLPAMPASSKPVDMTVSAHPPSGVEIRRFTNILVGDVWFVSGQSNMAMQLSEASGGSEAVAKSNNYNLRHFIVSRPDAPAAKAKDGWKISNPETTQSQSAVGYFFASEIQKKLGIPIGLINSSYGGTVTETWCPPEMMKKNWPAWETSREQALKNPKAPIRNTQASYLYERMVQPLTSFPVKGFLWYQGEGNASRAEEQKQLLPAMIQGWRRAWGNERLPFFFVQLARYEAADWHAFRCAQLDVWKNTPDTLSIQTVSKATSKTDSKPNIIFVVADDMGFKDTGHSGNSIARTPHLDRMAAEGVRFDNFYSAAGTCSPGRMAILTGRTPLRARMTTTVGAMQAGEVTVAAALKTAGYETGHFGKWGLGRDGTHPLQVGFDEAVWSKNYFDLGAAFFVGDSDKRDEAPVKTTGDTSLAIMDIALDFIGKRANRDQPFFVQVCFGSPHAPHQAAEEFKRLYPDLPENERNIWGEISGLDAAVGKLREDPLTSGTEVSFTQSPAANLAQPITNLRCLTHLPPFLSSSALRSYASVRSGPGIA